MLQSCSLSESSCHAGSRARQGSSPLCKAPNLAPKKPTRDLHAYRVDAELADGVVYQNDTILHTHPDVPIGPAALVWPVLVALLL